MRKILILSLLLLSCPTFVFAQQSTNPEQMQKQMEKMRQEFEKRQQEDLENLKKTDPKAYQERNDSLDRQAKINSILTSFHAGKISVSQAEQQLYPLVKQNIKDMNVDAEIARLEKRLEYLKKVKRDPDLLIKKRIDELLGRSTPMPEEF